jgi:hypothetical protein
MKYTIFMKKEYEKPKSIDLSETTDVNDILEATSKFSDATAEEISDIFSI